MVLFFSLLIRYFLRKLKKVKKSNGQMLAINEVLSLLDFGFWFFLIHIMLMIKMFYELLKIMIKCHDFMETFDVKHFCCLIKHNFTFGLMLVLFASLDGG